MKRKPSFLIFRPTVPPHRRGPGHGENQKGQAVIELAIIMCFLAMILLGLTIIAEFASKNVIALQTLRQEMRVSMAENADGPFTFREKTEVVTVNVPGRMKSVFGTPFISQDHRISFYEGSYQGAGKSFYRKQGNLVRKIDIQD